MGGDTKAEWWHKDVRDTDGTGQAVQQMLLQVLRLIFDPMFSEHSCGFRPGCSAQDAVRAAQRYAQEGKDWVIDFDIARFFATSITTF